MTANQFIYLHLVNQPAAIDHEWITRRFPAPTTLEVRWRATSLAPSTEFWRDVITLPPSLNVVVVREVRVLGWRVTLWKNYLRENTDGEFDLVGESSFNVV